MPESITRLANPLPLITLPTAFPNGAPGRWSLDPYLTNNTLWGGNDAVRLKTNGRNGIQNGNRINIGLSQALADGLVEAWYYFEVLEINGVINAVAGGNNQSIVAIYEPGVWLMEYYGSSNGVHVFEFPQQTYIYDPTFKYLGLDALPFGSLPLVAAATNPSWCTGTVADAAIKRSDGLIALDMSKAVGEASLTWKNNWSGSATVDITVTVLSLPVGGELKILGSGGVTALLITEPGVYTIRTALGAGEYPTITNNTSVPGNAIISRMMASTYGHWTNRPVEGPLFVKLGCVWWAPKDIFDAIIYPKTVFASVASMKPNMSGFVPTPGEPLLGYGSMPPPSGQFRVGDTVRNSNAVAGSVSGWRCTAAGNPGTWMPLATL